MLFAYLMSFQGVSRLSAEWNGCYRMSARVDRLPMKCEFCGIFATGRCGEDFVKAFTNKIYKTYI